jgi:hypothetical protein
LIEAGPTGKEGLTGGEKIFSYRFHPEIIQKQEYGSPASPIIFLFLNHEKSLLAVDLQYL